MSTNSTAPPRLNTVLPTLPPTRRPPPRNGTRPTGSPPIARVTSPRFRGTMTSPYGAMTTTPTPTDCPNDPLRCAIDTLNKKRDLAIGLGVGILAIFIILITVIVYTYRKILAKRTSEQNMVQRVVVEQQHDDQRLTRAGREASTWRTQFVVPASDLKPNWQYRSQENERDADYVNQEPPLQFLGAPGGRSKGRLQFMDDDPHFLSNDNLAYIKQRAPQHLPGVADPDESLYETVEVEAAHPRADDLWIEGSARESSTDHGRRGAAILPGTQKPSQSSITPLLHGQSRSSQTSAHSPTKTPCSNCPSRPLPEAPDGTEAEAENPNTTDTMDMYLDLDDDRSHLKIRPRPTNDYAILDPTLVAKAAEDDRKNAAMHGSSSSVANASKQGTDDASEYGSTYTLPINSDPPGLQNQLSPHVKRAILPVKPSPRRTKPQLKRPPVPSPRPEISLELAASATSERGKDSDDQYDDLDL